MSGQPQTILWTQIILARALARLSAAAVARGRDGFCVLDTHAGPGWLDGLSVWRRRLLDQQTEFRHQDFFQALYPLLPDGQHPGSWLLASRVLRDQSARQSGLDAAIDVNDLDKDAIATAMLRREETRLRFWTHDWYSFLLARLAMAAPVDFVFIDPPPDDPRGPVYALDAALLLDTLKIPYLLCYPLGRQQDLIEQVGRCGIELHLDGDSGAGGGVLLGGGAESALLDLLGDLDALAPLLRGRRVLALPQQADADYVI